MNTNLAYDIVGLVTDENDRFYFVQKDGQTYALDKSEGGHALGESVTRPTISCARLVFIFSFFLAKAHQ